MTDLRGYSYARERAGAVARAMLGAENASEASIALACDRACGGDLADRALDVADRTFAATLALATGERTAKPATAAAFTRAIRADGAPSVRYADRPEVTGGLVTLKMRVKPGARSPGNTLHAPTVATDGAAGRMEQARAVAARDLTDAIRSFRTGRNGAAKDAARGKIRAILHTWEGDAAIVAVATDAGWKV